MCWKCASRRLIDCLRLLCSFLLNFFDSSSYTWVSISLILFNQTTNSWNSIPILKSSKQFSKKRYIVEIWLNFLLLSVSLESQTPFNIILFLFNELLIYCTLLKNDFSVSLRIIFNDKILLLMFWPSLSL